MMSLRKLAQRSSQSIGGLLQVQLSVVCHLVTPKQVVPGSLKLMPSLLHFCGDPPGEEQQLSSSLSGSPDRHKVSQAVSRLHAFDLVWALQCVNIKPADVQEHPCSERDLTCMAPQGC